MSRFIQDFASLRSLGPMAEGFGRPGTQHARNAAGTELVEYDRGNNLFLQSVDLSVSPWSPGSNIAVTQQSDGWAKLEAIASTTSYHLLRPPAYAVEAGEYYGVRVLAKAGIRDKVGIRTGSVTSPTHTEFDFTTETFVVTNADVVSASATDLGDGVWELIVVAQADATASRYFGFALSNNGQEYWAATAGDSVYIKEPHFFEGQTFPGYTATGADNAAPAFDGPRGWLAEELRTNLLSNSIDLTNVTHWNGTTQITLTGGQSDILGGSDGFLIAPTATVSGHYIFDSVGAITSGNWYTLTFWGRPAGYDWIQVTTSTGFTGQKWRNVNLQDGSLGNGDLTADSDDGVLRVEAAPGGRFRVRLSAKATSTVAGQMIIAFLDSDRTSRLEAFAGDGSSGVIIEHPQFEQGAFPTSYIPTNGSTATRQPTTLTSSLSALGVDEVVNGIAGAISLYRKTPWDVPQGYGRFISLSSADGNERLDIHPSNGDSTIFATKYSGGSSVESIGSSTFDHRVNIDDAQLIVFRHTSSGFKMWITSDEQTVHEETTAAWQADWASSLVDLYAGSRNGDNNRVKAELFRSIQLWTGDDIPSDVELAALTADDLKMVPLDFSGATASEVLVEAPDVTRFRVGGDLNHVRWGVERTLVVGDGATRRYVPITLTAPVPTRFGAIVTPDATYHPGDAEAGDESYPLWLIGEGPHNPANGATSANVFEGGVASFLPMAYDLSAGAWIEGTAVPFAETASGGGALPGKLTMGRLAIGV